MLPWQHQSAHVMVCIQAENVILPTLKQKHLQGNLARAKSHNFCYTAYKKSKVIPVLN
jgi:hypothetical protein